MVLPSTQSGKAVLDELTNLSRAAKFRAGDFKALKVLQSQLKELESLKKASKAIQSGLSTASKTTKETRQLYDSLNKRTQEIKKTADESKNLWKRFMEKFPNRGGNNNGGGGDSAKAARLGLAVSLLLDAIQVGFTTFMVFKNDEILNYNLASQTANLVASQDAFTRAINAQIQIKNIQEQLKVQENDFKEERLKQEVQNNFFKKQFNDLTYEVRKGREKVEIRLNEQIANFGKFKNDITYEVRKSREILEDKFSTFTASANQKITDIQNKFASQKQEFDKRLQSVVSDTASRLKGVETRQAKDYQQLQSSINNIEKGSVGAIQSKLADFQKQINQQGFLSGEIQAEINKEIAKALVNADAATTKALQAFKKELDTQIGRVEFDKDKIKSDIQKLLLNKNKSDLLEQKFIDLEVANKKSSDILNNLVSDFTKSTNQKIDNLGKRVDGIEQNNQARFGAIQSKLADIQKQINQQGYFSEEVRANLFKEIDKIVSESGDKNLLQLKAEIDKKLLPFYGEQSQLKQEIQKILLDKNKTDELREKTIALEKSYAASQKVLDEVLNTSNGLQNQVKQLERNDTKQGNQIQKVDNKVTELEKKREGDFTLITRINDRVAAIDKYSQDTRFIITRVNDEIVNVKQNINGQLKDIDRKTFERLKPEIGGEVKSQFTTVQPQINQLKQADRDLNTRANDIERQLEKTVKPDIEKLNTKIKERENVDKEANNKLGQILGLVSLIPGIPAKASNFITPKIPTIPQIEQAAATGTCRTTKPGGCMRKMFDDGVGNINQNINNGNNKLGNILNGLNTGLNTAQIPLLNTINNKLGAQLPGGLAGKLVDGFKWLHLDRVLNVLTFAATVQNHLMLSNDIAQTLIGAFTNVLTLIGIKDDSGNPLDVGKIINSSIENLVKGIVGAENYAVISERWAKAVRVYQATANVLNAFQNLASTMLNALEITAGRVGKIGNALRKAGEVLENAYSWMNPQPKFNRVTQTLENLQNGASTIQVITQAPLDVINATTELTNATTEFTKALKEDGKPENKGNDDQEPEQLKAAQIASKAASLGQEMTEADLEADED